MHRPLRQPWRLIVLSVFSATALTAQMLAAAEEQGSWPSTAAPGPFQLVASESLAEATEVTEPSGSLTVADPSTDKPAAESIRLAPPSDPHELADAPVPQNTSRALTTVASSLACVLGLFLLIAWITKKALPRASAPLSQEVIEVLGRAPLSPRQQMHLVRVGRRLILLSVAAGAIETLTEITDPAEVDHLLGLCQQSRPSSATSSFRQVLGQLGSDPAETGYFGGSG